MKQKCFSWGKVILAAFFLFNPPINLIDILPDFVGYLLLLVAIKNATVVFPHFDEAYRGFEKMFWITLLKLPALLVMLSVIRLNSSERAMITVFALAFAVLEFIFALSAFRSFFAALTHLGGREGLLPVLKAGRHRRGIDGVFLWTMTLLFTKGFCSFVPELTLISVFETLGSLDANAVNPARYYPYLLVLLQFAGFILGVVWLYYTVTYFRDLKNSKVMRAFSKERATLYNDVFEENSVKRVQRTALFVLTVALLFAFDITLDQKNYLPDVLSAAVFFGLFMLLRKSSRFSLCGAGCALLYGGNSVTAALFQKAFLSEYTYTDVARRPEAASAYLPTKVFGILEALSLIALCLLLFFVLRDFIRKNVGATFDESNRALALSLQKELTIKAAILSALGSLSAIFFAAEKFLLTLVERHVITDAEANQYYTEGTVIYIPVFGGSWMLGLIFTALWVCYGIYFISSLRSELYAEEIS